MIDVLGQFEIYVLTAVLQSGEQAYGMTIHEAVEKLIAPRFVAIGAVYTTLNRLEKKGFIDSFFGDPTPARGGRAKKFYRLNAAGRDALVFAAAPISKVAFALDALGLAGA
jgi:PadR family transcriptional regulator, regulatory protein PadR